MSELRMLVESIFNKFENDEITMQEAKDMIDALGVVNVFKVTA